MIRGASIFSSPRELPLGRGKFSAPPHRVIALMRCPICKRPVNESERTLAGSSYPFCTDRCKLIDLGRWLDGAYQIPVADDTDAQAPEPPTEPQSPEDE